MKRLFAFCFLLFTFYSSFAQYLIYGTTQGAEVATDYGSIYSYNPVTHKQTILFNFNNTNGAYPQGSMLCVSDSILYGMTEGGGANGKGTLFSFNLKTKKETVLVSFNGTNGTFGPGGNELIQGKDGLLYGTTWNGGATNNGVLFSYNIKTNKDSVRCNFNDSTALGSRGGGAYMELWQDTTTGILYGTTEGGGYPGQGGVIYGFNPKNNQLKRYFVGTFYGTPPWELTGGLTLAKNGLLYGMSLAGGIPDSGTIYSFNINTQVTQTVYQFTLLSGAGPNGNELLQAANGILYGGTRQGGDKNNDGVLFSFNPFNNTEKVLRTFHDTDGSQPLGRLIQDPENGLLYGITAYGGDTAGHTFGYGVLFSYDTNTNVCTKLLEFTGLNGAFPNGLTLVDTTKGGSGAGIVQTRDESEKVKIYPNPSGGVFQVEMTNNQTGNSNRIEVYNVLGERVYQSSINTNGMEINLSWQPQGVYFYRVLTNTGSLVGEGKLVKE